MTADVGTIVWKEWKELFAGRGRRSTLLTTILPLAFVAIVLPVQFGPAWVSSGVMLATWAWLPLFLTVSVIADSFAGERERHTLETLLASRLSDRDILFGKIAAAVMYAWGLTLMMLVVALVTVNVVHGNGTLLLYSPAFAFAGVGVSLLAAVLAAGAGVLVSLRSPTARQAQQTVSVGVMLLLFVPLFGFQLLPDAWRAAVARTFAETDPTALVLAIAAALLLIDGALVAVASARFRRARLIVD